MSDTAPNGASGSMVDHRGRPRVAVTGMGLKTPAGNDVASFWETVLAGRPMAANIESFDTSYLPVRFACQVKDFDAVEVLHMTSEADRKVRGVEAGDVGGLGPARQHRLPERRHVVAGRGL
ncbi:MAG: beta-ketoacyl synthase N-terminal-like domain-containing protein, partial [Acidimicrobiia bacterium]